MAAIFRVLSGSKEKKKPAPSAPAATSGKTKLRQADFKLKSHDHGKARVRVLKVRRSTERHEVAEFTVATKLFSDEYAKCYYEGDNTGLVATDTQKNTVYVVAKRTGCETPEDFATELCKHFLATYPVLSAVEAEVDERSWDRAKVRGEEHDHAFTLGPAEVSRARARLERGGRPVVTSSIVQMNVLKTTQSSFEGFLHDEYTLLPDCTERCLATELTAEWTYVAAAAGEEEERPDFASVRAGVREELLLGLFGPSSGGVLSKSLQASVYDAACLVLSAVPSVQEISILTPNVHFLPMKALAQLGKESDQFEDDVFIPTSAPSGTIACTVARS